MKIMVPVRFVSLVAATALLAFGCTEKKASVASGSSQRGATSNSGLVAQTGTGTQLGGASKSSGKQVAQAEKPVAPMRNPSGDIPDSQQFVTYTSGPGNYSLEVPEGWARSGQGANVQFDFNYDGLWVHVSREPTVPDAGSVRANQVKTLESAGHAVTVKSVSDIRIDGKSVVLVKYDSNSPPNAVTNKQIRLENDAYYYYKSGTLVELRLWAPLGADNVDQWNRISRSFAWK